MERMQIPVYQQLQCSHSRWAPTFRWGAKGKSDRRQHTDTEGNTQQWVTKCTRWWCKHAGATNTDLWIHPASASGTSGLTEVARKYQNNLGDRELTVNTLCLHNMGSFCFSYSISLFPALIHHFGLLLSLSLLTLFMPLYSLSCSLGLIKKFFLKTHTQTETHTCVKHPAGVWESPHNGLLILGRCNRGDGQKKKTGFLNLSWCDLHDGYMKYTQECTLTHI